MTFSSKAARASARKRRHQRPSGASAHNPNGPQHQASSQQGASFQDPDPSKSTASTASQDEGKTQRRTTKKMCFGGLNSFEEIFEINLENYRIVAGHEDEIYPIWTELSTIEKRELISLNEENIVSTMNRVFCGKIKMQKAPSSQTVSLVQASFLHAMEANDGYMALKDFSMESMAVLMALEERLMVENVKRDIYRKCALVCMYFVWLSRLGWIGIIFAVFVVSSSLEPCVKMRKVFCKATELFFVSHPDPSYVKWQAHTYITAFLLLYIASGAQAYIMIGVLLCIPYILSFVETNLGSSKNTADQKALRNIRNGMSYLNKLVLIYFAWGEYSSLFLVSLLFFSRIAMYMLYLALLLSGALISGGLVVLKVVVPTPLRNSFIQWKSKGFNSLVLAVIPLVISASIFYYSWLWTSPYGSLTRAMTLVMTFHMLPIRLVTISVQLLLLLSAFPIQIIHVISSKCLDLVNSVFKTKYNSQAGQNTRKYAYGFRDETNFRHQD